MHLVVWHSQRHGFEVNVLTGGIANRGVSFDRDLQRFTDVVCQELVFLPALPCNPGRPSFKIRHWQGLRQPFFNCAIKYAVRLQREFAHTCSYTAGRQVGCHFRSPVFLVSRLSLKSRTGPCDQDPCT